MSEETIQRLRGQLQNCVNHLGMMKGRSCAQSERKLDECIESANKALYETLHEAPETIPQDVEEFIAKHARDRDGVRHRGGDYIPVDDLRSWMTGHVRVPVEPTEKMLEAGAVSNGGRMFSQHVRALYQAMLNASKGE